MAAPGPLLSDVCDARAGPPGRTLEIGKRYPVPHVRARWTPNRYGGGLRYR